MIDENTNVDFSKWGGTGGMTAKEIHKELIKKEPNLTLKEVIERLKFLSDKGYVSVDFQQKKNYPEDVSDFEGNYPTQPATHVMAYDEHGNELVDITDPDKAQGFCPRKDLRDESPKYDEKLWNELIRIGQEIEKGLTGTAHEFPLEYEINGVKKSELDFEDLAGNPNLKYKNNPMIEAIIKTLEYFGADSKQVYQMKHDFYIARYRIFDALGMYYTGALWAKGRLFEAIEKLVKLYVMQKNVGGFCWFLRGHDLDVEEPSHCVDCITSYKNWIKDIPEGRTMNDFT